MFIVWRDRIFIIIRILLTNDQVDGCAYEHVFFNIRIVQNTFQMCVANFIQFVAK